MILKRFTRLLLLACAAALFVLPLDAQDTGPQNALPGLNNALLQLYSQTLGASPAQAAAARREAEEVISDRALALEALIAEDPAQALAVGFSTDLLEDLRNAFPDSAPQLEQRGSFTGIFEVEIADNEQLTSGRETRGLRIGAIRLELFFAEETNATPGLTLTVEGMSVGGSLAAGSSEEQGSLAGPQNCSVTGEQRIAVLKVRYPGTSPSLANANIEDWLFGPGDSVSSFWYENSFGQTSSSGDVYPAGSDSWYDLSQSYDCTDDFSPLMLAAMSAADGDVDFNEYERILVVFPNSMCSGIAGRASLDCSRYAPDGSPGVTWAIQRVDQMDTQSSAVMLTTHEGGHNLGLHHSSSLDYGSEPLGDPSDGGSQSEYGDIFSTMGSWNDGHYSADHKRRLGWLPSYQTVSNSGTFNLAPYSNSVGTQALRVDRGGTGQHVWIEFRRRLGQYYSTKGDPTNGALIHFQSDSKGRPRLLDFTPQTSTFGDSVLAAGQEWSDPYSNLTISTLSASDSSLQVNISYGALECAPQQPSVSIGPSSQTTYSPNPASYTVSVANNDSPACPPRVFNMSGLVDGPGTATLPFSLGSPSQTIAPGSSDSSSLTVNTQSPTAYGSYVVSATATRSDDSSYADSATAGLALLEPSYTLSLNVSGNGVITVLATGVTCSGTCDITIPQSLWSDVTLEAASTHRKHQFCGWTDACSAATGSTCSLPTGDDYLVGASFGTKCSDDGGGTGGGGGGGGNGNGKGGGKPK